MGYDAKKNVHAGHRERLRGSFVENGADSFRTHQLLELLLFYAIPYKDTNPIAHALISRFGSLRGVLEASVEELETVSGVGRSVAIMLHSVSDYVGDYLESGRDDELCFNYVRKIGRYLLKFYAGSEEEFVSLMLLDNRNCLISCRKVFDGDVSSAALHPSVMIEQAILSHASGAIIAHNHPHGMAIPSSNDLDITREFSRAFAASGINLIDHIIIANNDFCSVLNSAPAMFLASSRKNPKGDV